MSEELKPIVVGGLYRSKQTGKVCRLITGYFDHEVVRVKEPSAAYGYIVNQYDWRAFTEQFELVDDAAGTTTTTEDPKPPRRRVELTISLGADSWQDAAFALQNIALKIPTSTHKGGDSFNMVSGGYASGYVFEGSEDPSVTHESWFKALEEYLEKERTRVSHAAKGGQG